MGNKCLSTHIAPSTTHTATTSHASMRRIRVRRCMLPYYLSPHTTANTIATSNSCGLGRVAEIFRLGAFAIWVIEIHLLLGQPDVANRLPHDQEIMGHLSKRIHLVKSMTN